MAGIKFACRSDCKIFRSASATRNALVNTRTAFEIEHIVIEGERLALFSSFYHHIGKFFVLLVKHFLVVFGERVFVGGRTHDGFHAEFVESEIEHCLNVVGEIGIAMSERAAHIIILAAARFDEFLKFRHDYIVTSHVAYRLAKVVIDFLSSVKAEHDVVHLFVGKFDHVVVNEHAVGGERKAEIFAVFFFNRTRVCNKIFDDLPIHKRLSAEKVHLEIAARSAVFDEKIKRTFAHFVRHKRTLAVIFALRRKAILAVEIASVRDVKAHGFKHGVAFCEIFYIGLKLVFCKEFALSYKLVNVVQALYYILFAHAVLRVFCSNFLDNFFMRFRLV